MSDDKIIDLILQEQRETRKEIKELRKTLNTVRQDIGSLKLKVTTISSLVGAIIGTTVTLGTTWIKKHIL